jgi:hypothetical protein
MCSKFSEIWWKYFLWITDDQKKFEIFSSSIANIPKQAILEISKKNEIFASSEILFLFIVDTYKTNKL